MKKLINGLVGLVFVVTFVLPSTALAAKPKPKSYIPYGATAMCKDGTFSYSKNHRGTCSHHRGVKRWYR
jgi:hypothetical protein